MKCSRHREQDAIGVCAACGKGLCSDACAQDGAFGLHCDAACAERLRRRASSWDEAVAVVWSALMRALGAGLV